MGRKTADGIPIYRKIQRDIVAKIHDGVYRPGDRLPGMRALAKQYGASTQAVYDAVRILSQAGYLVTEPHRGLFVARNLQRGFYYRIGIFTDRINPLTGMRNVLQFHQVCRKNSFELIPGSNFETESTLDDFLKQHPNLDALVLFGNLSRETLDLAVRSGLPYRIWGNYGFPDSYKQLRVSMKPLERHAMRMFEPHAGKKIFIMLGEKNSVSDRLYGNLLLRAAQTRGLVCSENDLIYSSDLGYEVMCERFRAERPDILLTTGGLIYGIRQFFTEHPELPMPEIWADANFPVAAKPRERVRFYRTPDILKASVNQLFGELYREMKSCYINKRDER